LTGTRDLLNVGAMCALSEDTGIIMAKVFLVTKRKFTWKTVDMADYEKIFSNETLKERFLNWRNEMVLYLLQDMNTRPESLLPVNFKALYDLVVPNQPEKIFSWISTSIDINSGYPIGYTKQNDLKFLIENHTQESREALLSVFKESRRKIRNSPERCTWLDILWIACMESIRTGGETVGYNIRRN
jgi:hypothetical protein